MGDASSATVEQARQLLAALAGTRPDDDASIDAAVRLAGLLLEESERQKNRQDRQREALLGQLMIDDAGQAFTTLLTDRAYRSREPQRIVDVARQLIRRLGIPDYLPRFARVQMQALLRLGPFAAARAAEGLHERLRSESSHVVLAAEEPALSDHLAARAAAHTRVNLNHLGEAVLGEEEATARIAQYISMIERADVESISVKVSSIYSQIELLAWDETLSELKGRLREIYRSALAHPYVRPDGTRLPTLVNLDMEAYRDLHLTLDAFRAVMDEEELLPLTAGVVLQAYLPDSAPLQRELTDWARARVARGGAPVRLRLVKGANLLTERVEAALHGWTVPIYGSKAEVDANFKKMLEYGCEPEHAAAVELGIASHNLFDQAYGLVLRASRGVEQRVSVELIEGMADPMRRTLCQLAQGTLVYAPVVEQDAMQSAIAYLMRRLDENTAEENYLRHSLTLRVGDEAWEEQRARFERAIRERGGSSERVLRHQDRGREPAPREGRFENASDTDFVHADSRAWILEHVARREAQHGLELASQIGGEHLWRGPFADGFDPSRPGVTPYRLALAQAEDVQAALANAAQAAPEWAKRSVGARAEALRAIAAGLRAKRGELISAMVLDGGKRIDQADVEVSEAIDFAEYYAESFTQLADGVSGTATLSPKGVVLVTPPWNFPLAIPCGGVVAGLMAGNAVILKPALETVLVAELLARVCWEAGVPKRVLQLVLCEDEVASALVRDARVDHVVLTGATATACLFRELRPGIDLAAETGGKNSIIVSAMADRDQAIKDVVYSAFGHAGQKCSACSLLICEAEVYDDGGFRETLRDATESLPVGPAWDARAFVTPLIHPARDPLLRGLTNLEEGERWLVEPKRDARNPRMWSPGIKLGVREGSFTHVTEFFGPVLGVMRADDLDHALRLASGTPYGLTAGLHSLDEREQQRWARRMPAGNLYINRAITGAIVRRQPFGGYKDSAFGAGAKAGGPNYVLQMTHARHKSPPSVACPPVSAAADLLTHVRRPLSEAQREALSLGACDYALAWREHFGVDHDPSQVLGERNRFRYRPCEPMMLRASDDADVVDVLLACAAALTAGLIVELSVAPEVSITLPHHDALPGVGTVVEPEASCAGRASSYDRVRAIGSPEPEVQRGVEGGGGHYSSEPVLQTGRIELLRYLREQSVSHQYHRYGNLAGERLLG